MGEPEFPFHVFHLLMPLSMIALTYFTQQIFKVNETLVAKLLKLLVCGTFYTVYTRYYFDQDDREMQLLTCFCCGLTGLFCLVINSCIFSSFGRCLCLTQGDQLDVDFNDPIRTMIREEQLHQVN